MKRFALFMASYYYPKGGMLDFKGSFDSLSEAVEFANKTQKEDLKKGYLNKEDFDFANIWDMQEIKNVAFLEYDTK